MSGVPQTMVYTIRLHRGVVNSFSHEDIVLTDAQVAGSIGELRDSLCATEDLDAATHALFLDSRCLDHATPVAGLPWTAAGTVALRLSIGSLRVRFTNNTVPDTRLFVDLSPARPVADLLAQIRFATGYFVTPTAFVCKGVHVEPTLSVVEKGDGNAVTDVVDRAATLADTDVKLDDVVLLVRNSDTIVVTGTSDAAAAEAAESTILDLVFYGQHHRVTLPASATIAELKEHLCAEVFKTASTTSHMKVSMATELRVVQCNTNFANDSLLSDLQRLPVEILRQWGPEHLALQDNFAGYGALSFNCPFCATSGATVELRPMCGLCNCENLEVHGSRRCWSDVVDSMAHCHGCEGEVHIYWGFFCKGMCCDARCSTHRRRDMISIYDSAQDQTFLLAAINSCFSFSSGAGHVDASAIDRYVAVQVACGDAAASAHIPTALDLTAAADWDALEGGGAAEHEAAKDAPAVEPVGDAEPDKKVATAATDDDAVTTASVAPTTGDCVLSTVAAVDQDAMLGHGLHLPDTFFTRSRRGGAVYQWFGMQEGYTLVRVDSPQAATVDAAIPLPCYNISRSDSSGADAQPTAGGQVSYVLVPCVDNVDSGVPGSPDALKTAAGAGGSGGARGWLMGLLSAEVAIGPFKWSPFTGFVSRSTAELAYKHAATASNRLRVTIQPLKPLTASAYHRLVNSVLTMDALSQRSAVADFCSRFACVDDLYVSNTPRSGDSNDSGGASAPPVL